jgi:hypothetical protein
VVELPNDRRAEDRRTSERRHAASQGGARRHERRKGSRRRQIAGAGLLAAAAFAGVKSYSPQGMSWRMQPQAQSESTVDVEEEDFRLPTYDKEALEPYIQEAAAMHGVSPDLVRAVVQTESQFNPLAVSPVGAQGLMQLMPNTAKAVGLEDPFDPRQNVLSGTKYLSMMLERFNGNTALALAGYNAGPGNVRRYRGVPPFGETRGYLKKIQHLVAGSDAAFSIPTPPKPKVRKASLRSGKKLSKGSVAKKSIGKRSSLSKARTTRASSKVTKAKVGRARTTAAKAKAKATSSRTGAGRRA